MNKDSHKLPSLSSHWPEFALDAKYLYADARAVELSESTASIDALVQAGLPADIFRTEPKYVGLAEGHLQPAIMAPCPLDAFDNCAGRLPEGEDRKINEHFIKCHKRRWDECFREGPGIHCPVPSCGWVLSEQSFRSIGRHLAAHTRVPGKQQISCLFADCNQQFNSARSRSDHLLAVHNCSALLCMDPAKHHACVYLIKPIKGESASP